RRQRYRVQVVAEADRRDVVEADLDVVGGEVAQRRRHQPHQAVEDDLQHRQALVGDQRRVDDGADAGALGGVVVGEVEAQQAVDLILIEDALGGDRPVGGGRGVLPAIAQSGALGDGGFGGADGVFGVGGHGNRDQAPSGAS